MSAIDPQSSPDQAAQEIVCKVIEAAESRLMNGIEISAKGGSELARFIAALHADLTAHFATSKNPSGFR